MATLKERCDARKFVKSNVRYYVYRGKEHDLYIALPDYEELQRCFEIIFDKEGVEAPFIVFRKRCYELKEPPLLSEDNGYYCIQGKFKGSKGLHKIPLHRLAYVAFYGTPPVGYHIHHLDRNKHNNAADNLVALTEEEHSRAHGRDVSVQRNLFTKPIKKRDLLSSRKELTLGFDATDEVTTLVASKLTENIDNKVERLVSILFSEYSTSSFTELLSAIEDIKDCSHSKTSLAVIDVIYKLISEI